MKNIELKISINNSNKIISALKDIKAKRIGVLHQKDVYYRCRNGRLKTRTINNKKNELIFYRRPNRVGKKISNYQIFNIQPNRMQFVESSLNENFGKQIVVKKKRELWIYKHTRIHIDEVSDLGNFLEIETVIKNVKTKTAEHEFKWVVDSLGLNQYNKCNLSYSDLLLRNEKIGPFKLKTFNAFNFAKQTIIT